MALKFNFLQYSSAFLMNIVPYPFPLNDVAITTDSTKHASFMLGITESFRCPMRFLPCKSINDVGNLSQEFCKLCNRAVSLLFHSSLIRRQQSIIYSGGGFTSRLSRLEPRANKSNVFTLETHVLKNLTVITRVRKSRLTACNSAFTYSAFPHEIGVHREVSVSGVGMQGVEPCVVAQTSEL
ncbi:hypothetical protein NQ318_001185 [Aromia moschata]|uniref:Uncharacterized protein n=1 Tax=Aromia moschata TaxID=1265417 RepID=A0AAV8ZEG5_9CUCU|nr:hypothetical protein NQ318_001185 [Aromia moschata]